MSKTLTILGSGRSGTSYLIKTLNANGVPVGNCTSGTMENLDVRRINDGYLAQYHQAVKNSGLPYGILPNEEIKVTDDTYLTQAKLIVESHKNRYKENDFWAFKDPRTTLLHDLWLPHTDMVIAVFRHPEEVVESYTKLLSVYYDDLDECRRNMLAYWKRYNQSLLWASEHYTNIPFYILEFNESLNDNLNQIFGTQLKQIQNLKTNKNSGNLFDNDTKNLYITLKEKSKLWKQT